MRSRKPEVHFENDKNDRSTTNLKHIVKKRFLKIENKNLENHETGRNFSKTGSTSKISDFRSISKNFHSIS